MPLVCTFKDNAWWCDYLNEKYKIKALHSYGSNDITNKTHILTVEIHDKNVNYFPEGLGSHFPRLRSLTISYCGLKSITRDQLKGLENLEKLDLTSNLLTSLPDDLFTDMKRLTSISFKNNQLESMSSKLLKPILKNNPTLIDFQGNFEINAIYSNKYIYQIVLVSLEELMEIIDTSCKKPADEQVQVSTIESFKEDFTAGLANLWESGEHSDLIIIANGPKAFRVHKNVLAIQSPVFAAIFKNNMKEPRTYKMVISDFSAGTVEQFLACLYTGKIKDVTNAMELFALAAKYDVPKLKTASGQNILQNINESNAYDVFALGHLHSSSVMLRKAFDIIKQTLTDIKLDDDLMKDPEKLKALIAAIGKRQKKIQESKDEIASLFISKK